MISEEHPDSAGCAECVWVIYQIDGTRSFIARRPVFGTLIALAIGEMPVLCVVDIPVTQERWVGAKRHPMRLNGDIARTRSCASMSDAILLATSLEHLGEEAAGPFSRIAGESRFNIYDAGTLGYGLVANGHPDIMIAARYGIVNYLAAVPVIEGAGGVVRPWDGSPLTIHSGDRIVALGNAARLPEALMLLEQSEAKG